VKVGLVNLMGDTGRELSPPAPDAIRYSMATS